MIKVTRKLQWAKKEKVDSRALDEWECRILETIQTRIDRIRKKDKNPRKEIFYRTNIAKNTLRIFRNVLF